MHAQFPISKPNLLLPVAISIKKRNIITMSLSSLRVNFCNYNTSLGQMCENGRLIPASICLFLAHSKVAGSLDYHYIGAVCYAGVKVKAAILL